jgi:hypothetical protein
MLKFLRFRRKLFGKRIKPCHAIYKKEQGEKLMRKIRILLLVLTMLLLLSANAFAGLPVNTDERFTFLGEANGLYYYGWADTNGQSVNKEIWVKIIPGDTIRELLQEQGDLVTANQIDSVLCRITVKDGKALQVAEQIYYDSSGTDITRCASSEWSGFIADQCAAFLTAYFSYK